MRIASSLARTRSGPIDLSSPSLGAIRRTSAVDTVRARISLAVQLGMLVPGQKLPSPEETAQAFEVGEITVRRAYRALSDEGLVVSRRGNAGGTFIADSPPAVPGVELAAYRADIQHVHGLIDQRATLEAGLAAVASTARTADQLSAMTDLIHRMREAADWAAYREADAEFHAQLADASGMPAAAALHNRVSHELYAYFIPYRLDLLQASNDEHVQIVAALERRDAGDSSRRAFEHVSHLHESMYVGLSAD